MGGPVKIAQATSLRSPFSAMNEVCFIFYLYAEIRTSEKDLHTSAATDSAAREQELSEFTRCRAVVEYLLQ